MKSKDIINEGLFGDFERAASQFKRAYDTRQNATAGLGGRVKALFSPTRMKYGRSTKDQVAANKFIDKFVSQALETLDVAVKNDLVDATSNKLDDKPAAQPAQQEPAVKTAASQNKKPKPKTKQPAANTPAEPITFGREKYTKGPKGWIDSKGKPADQNTTKILDQAAQQSTAQTNTKQAGAQQPNAPAAKTKAAAPKAAAPKAAAPKAAAPKAAAPKAAAPKVAAKPAAQPAAAKAAAQPRQTVAQKIAPQLQAKAARKTAGKRNQPIKEDAVYEKLNLLFESYMELIEASSVPQGGGRVKGAGLSQTPNAIRKREARAKAKASGQQAAPKAAPKAAPQQPQTDPASQQQVPPTEEKLGISKYFKENFLDDFLQGIDMGPAKPKIDALLKNLPNLYGTSQLKKELTSIANIAWTLAKK